MTGSRRVQSARISTTFLRANAARTSASLRTSRLLTWHVTHHAAVKSTNTARPELVRSARRAGVYGSHALSLDDFATGVGDAFALASACSNGHATTNAHTAATNAATLQPFAAPPRNMCHDHSAKPTMTSVASKRTTASLSTCAPITHASHATVAYSGNARTCFSRAIQGPGRGNARRHPGSHASSTKGSAMPTPKAMKTAIVAAAGCASANPSPAPMNGAVQGDAMITASAPVSDASA